MLVTFFVVRTETDQMSELRNVMERASDSHRRLRGNRCCNFVFILLITKACLAQREAVVQCSGLT